LRPGICCPLCSQFYSLIDTKNVICSACKRKENLHSAIFRIVEEFKLLFPEKKITTIDIYNWCKPVRDKKNNPTISCKTYQLKGHGSSSHYVEMKVN
jgi:hypothetical protein